MAGAIWQLESANEAGNDDRESPSYRTEWMCARTRNLAVVRSLAAAKIPRVHPHSRLYLQNQEFSYRKGGVWVIVATYGRYPKDGVSKYSFTTSGGTQHITQSITQRNYGHSYGSDGDSGSDGNTPIIGGAPDFGGAIGVDGEGNIQGTDIIVPVFNFTETHYLSPAAYNCEYIALLHTLTGRVNDRRFRMFPAGSCLFKGVQGNFSEADKFFEVTFTFDCIPTTCNITVGDDIYIGGKEGWEYLWVRYKQIMRDGYFVKIPSSAHVAQVYEYASFDLLGLGEWGFGGYCPGFDPVCPDDDQDGGSDGGFEGSEAAEITWGVNLYAMGNRVFGTIPMEETGPNQRRAVVDVFDTLGPDPEADYPVTIIVEGECGETVQILVQADELVSEQTYAPFPCNTLDTGFVPLSNSTAGGTPLTGLRILPVLPLD